MAANRFGAWLAARRVPRIAFIAGFFNLGLFGLVSTATVILSAITHGWRVAAADCLIAGAALGGLTLAASGSVEVLALSAGTIWPVAIGLGSLTGKFGTLTLPLQALLVLAMLLVVGFYVVVGDTVSYWTEALQVMARELEAAGVQLAAPDALAAWAPLMTGLTAALIVLTLALALVLGSWWAGGVSTPGLGMMFRQLRLGNVIGGLAAVLGVASLAGGSQLTSDLLLVLATGFVLQGLAVIHWQFHARKWPGAFLLLVYLPMLPVLAGPAVAAGAWLSIAAIGFIDNWFVLRRSNENMV
jgi:hypothetical protein